MRAPKCRHRLTKHPTLVVKLGCANHFLFLPAPTLLVNLSTLATTSFNFIEHERASAHHHDALKFQILVPKPKWQLGKFHSCGTVVLLARSQSGTALNDSAEYPGKPCQIEVGYILLGAGRVFFLPLPLCCSCLSFLRIGRLKVN